MRFILAFLLGALVADVYGQSIYFEDGKEYTYDTEQAVRSGTMDYVSGSAGFSYKMTLTVQVSGNTLNLRYSDLSFSQYVGMHDAKTWPFDGTTFTEVPKDGSASLELTSDGLFKSLTVPSDMKVSGRNLARALAAQFQINSKELQQGKKSFRSEEQALQGKCSMSYTSSSNVLRKSVSHNSDCEDLVYRVVDDFRGHWCHEETAEKDLGYPSSIATMVYDLDKSKNQINKMVSSSTFVAQFYEEEGSAMLVIANSTSILRGVKASPGDISVSGDTINDLAYEFNDKEYKWNQDRNLKDVEPLFTTGRINEESSDVVKDAIKNGLAFQKEIMKTLGNGDREALNKAHRYGVNNILPAFMALDYDGLKGLAEQFLADKSDTGVMTSNVFNELLASAGTTAAALVVRDLAMEGKFDNDRDAARSLLGVPYHIRRPNTQLVKEYEKLMDLDGERFTEMSVPLVLGHLVYTTCLRAGSPHSPEQKECFKTFANEYVNKMWNRYNSASSKEEKILLLSAMQNIKFGGQSDLLQPIIEGKTEEDPQIRLQALWATAWERFSTGKARSSLLPIFADPAYPHEMRIGALELLFHSKPSSADMNTIMAVLYRERNYEVLNYAVTLMERWVGNISPCAAKTSNLVKYYLKYMKQWSGYQPDFGFGVSKTYMRQFQKKKYGYGGSYVFYVIGSEDSTTPLNIGMSIEHNMMNSYENSFLSVHIRLEGVAKGLIRKFKTTDPSTWKTADLQNILSGDMGIRERPNQPVRAQITVLYKGQIIIQRVYDESDGTKEGKFASFLENLKNLGDTYSINHQRALNIGSYLYEQPTAIGMPLAVMRSSTFLGSIRATVKRGNHRGLLYRDVEYDIKTLSHSVRAAFAINPFRKAAFGTVNSRLYHLRVPRKFVIGVNPIKKELKLSVSRPSYDDPWKMIMHSHTALLARGANLKGGYDGLKNNCPSCENWVLLTKGPDYVKDRVFIERENQNMGSYLRGEYFDCEMNINRGNTVGRLLYALTPFNKSPKTLWTSLMMGSRQIRAFLFFFPKNEQCGAMVRWSQSESNPVKEIELTLRVNTEKNGERLFFRGRKIYIKALIKAKGEPADRTYRVNFAWEFTPGYLNNKVKLQVNKAAVAELDMSPYTMCLLLENQYPPFSKEFLGYDENAEMSVSGKAMVQYGKGSTCADTEGEIKIKFKHSTTQEAREKLKKKWYYQRCMELKNSPAWSGRTYALPVSEACYATVRDATSARRYTWKIDFVKVTKKMESYLNKIKTIGRAGLLPYWDLDPDSVVESDGIGPFLNWDVTLKDDEKLADVQIETRRGKETFEDVALRLNWSNRLRNLKFTRTIKRLLDTKILNPCTVTNSYVRTNDNVTYSYEPNSCWTLASAGCGPTPSYAVFTKSVGGSKPLAAMVYVGGHSIELSPSGIKIMGEAKDVAEEASETHTIDGVEIFKIFRWGNTYSIYSFLRVWITYDGNFINIIPAPSTKGQHCGMCGNYNRNKWDEMTSKDNTRLASPADMVENWKWKC